jgi:hypothetical protein
MSNNYQSNPLTFTVAPGVSHKNLLAPKYLPVSCDKRFIVVRVVWFGQTANGDTFQVTDGHGVVLAAGSVVTATLGIPQTTPVGVQVEDVQVTQLSSGTVQIYVQRD